MLLSQVYAGQAKLASQVVPSVQLNRHTRQSIIHCALSDSVLCIALDETDPINQA